MNIRHSETGSLGVSRKAYYAFPVSVLGTPQAKRDMDLIRAMGFVPWPIDEDREFALADYPILGMDVFRPFVQASKILVFRAFPDGSIPSGVAKEIAWAVEAEIPVVEIPRQVPRRTLSHEDTLTMLIELGQR